VIKLCNVKKLIRCLLLTGIYLHESLKDLYKLFKRKGAVISWQKHSGLANFFGIALPFLHRQHGGISKGLGKTTNTTSPQYRN